ncbi:MAG: hypothetical protein HOP17_01660 [Acidobacteria bacterium]|nr:hypothetical protein [Acidobacteriota bacterium]
MAKLLYYVIRGGIRVRKQWAFVIGELREVGETSRKALIVNFAAPHRMAETSVCIISCEA